MLFRMERSGMTEIFSFTLEHFAHEARAATLAWLAVLEDSCGWCCSKQPLYNEHALSNRWQTPSMLRNYDDRALP